MSIASLVALLGKLFKVCWSKRLLKALIFQRVLAGAEHHRIFAVDLSTVVDVGANRGQFALAVRRWAPKAKVIAFEPLAEAAECFRRVFQGDSEMTLHQAALGVKAGEAIIHVAAADDSSSLFPISSKQKRLFPGTSEIRTEIVKVGRLSDFVAYEDIVSPAMLKLDVQGYELEVLRGCEELLKRFSYVYAECSFMELYIGQVLADEIIVWLRRRGWCLSGVYNITNDCNGKSVQADFLFENSCFACAM